MQAGLTPLTFTVGPRPPPGLLALRRHQVTDPEPGAENHHCGWARAPHAERAAPNASATGTRRLARRYGGKLLQDAGERSKPGVARTNDATHSTHSSHWLAPKGPRTRRSTGALSFFIFFPPDWRVRTTAHAVPLQRGRKDALKLFVECLCERRDLHTDWRQRGRPRRLDRTQWAGGNVNSTRCLMGLWGARDL